MKYQASPLVAAFALFLISLSPAPVEEKAFARPLPQTPSEVIAIINDYRSQNGLPAYPVNDTLMSIAQGQADYLADIVQTNDVHAGPGGSRPRDRAFAAGYGGGQQFWISEIGKYGMGETPQSAVDWWKQSPDHNPTMVSSQYQEVGCGVSLGAEGRNYYICDMAYVVGGSYAPVNPNTGSQPTPAPVMVPVTVATPQPDGSIIHVLRTGQALWTLAAKYGVTLDQIYALNPEITNPALIPVGVEIIIAPPGTYPTTTPTQIEEEPTATPTATEEQIIQSTSATSVPPIAVVAPTARPTERPLVQSNPVALQAAAKQNSTVKMVVGVSLAGIALVFAASFFIQKPRPPEPPEDNDPFAPIN